MCEPTLIWCTYILCTNVNGVISHWRWKCKRGLWYHDSQPLAYLILGGTLTKAKDNRDVESRVDDAVLSFLPKDGEILNAEPLGLSDYGDTYEISVRLPDGTIERFFQKSASGQNGFELMKAHNTSEASLYTYIPKNVPQPIGFGRYISNSDYHFFIIRFVEMRDDDLPTPEDLMAAVAKLHLGSMGKSPTGKFGFGVKTWFAHLPQENGWEDSWEVWWTRHMMMVLDREEGMRGPHTPEDAMVKEGFMKKVLPRYLRPLETGGRSIQPTLLHTNLWPGNIKYQLDNDEVVIFDGNCFWGHNEVELGLIRNPRYPMGKAYIKEYWRQVPISEPQEDADSRNIMYLVRHQACLASRFPEDTTLRNIFVNSMRVLVNRLQEEEATKPLANMANSAAGIEVAAPPTQIRKNAAGSLTSGEVA